MNEIIINGGGGELNLLYDYNIAILLGNIFALVLALSINISKAEHIYIAQYIKLPMMQS